MVVIEISHDEVVLRKLYVVHSLLPRIYTTLVR